MEQDQLIQRLRDFAIQREWSQFHNPKNISMALVVEASELVEIFQWLSIEESSLIKNNPQKLANVKEEMADIYGYLLRLADILDVDLNDALAQKIESNARKYPIEEFRGSARKYNDAIGE